MDFFTKYNKFSTTSYDKKLKDTLSQNFKFLKTFHGLTSKSDMMDASNPMLVTDFNYQNNNSEAVNNNYNLTMNFHQNNFSSFGSGSGFKTSINMGNYTEMTASLHPQIKLNNTNSLLETLDHLNLITTQEERESKKAKNIFKKPKEIKNLFRKKKEFELREINKFTGSLLGSNVQSLMTKTTTNKLNPLRQPKKPMLNDLKKDLEIGQKLGRIRGAKEMAVNTASNFFPH